MVALYKTVRTYYYPGHVDAEEPLPRSDPRRRAGLADRLGDDLRRAPMVRPDHHRLDGADGMGARDRAAPGRTARHPLGLADRTARREAHDECRRRRPRSDHGRDPDPPL